MITVHQQEYYLVDGVCRHVRNIDRCLIKSLVESIVLLLDYLRVVSCEDVATKDDLDLVLLGFWDGDSLANFTNQIKFLVLSVFIGLLDLLLRASLHLHQWVLMLLA